MSEINDILDMIEDDDLDDYPCIYYYPDKNGRTFC